MKYVFERGNSRARDAAVFWEQRAGTLRLEAEEAERRLRDYQKRHNLVSLDNSTNLVWSAIVSSPPTKLALPPVLSVSASRSSSIKLKPAVTKAMTLLEISYVAQHGTVKALSTPLSDLRKNEPFLAETYLERHPRMILVDNEITVTERQLQDAIKLAIADVRSTLDESHYGGRSDAA
ncbi:MAG: hypothetical protein J6386_15420 [Candidatus Synoicihabitans palmerolidicus]|nr:hypothetical protein [Candidatus Synoicihabitans palmerolidicus]